MMPEEPNLDVGALRARYLAERDKRLRNDGKTQYSKLDGEFADFGVDPHVEPGFDRAPLVAHSEVIVVGGGFSGLMAAGQLKLAGVESVRVIDKAGDFGGTWYWNRYPGIACDVESYIYLPFLEIVGGMPVEKYSKGPEILRHCQAIGRHFGLYEDAIFQTRVTSIDWNEDAKHWVVSTDRGDRFSANFVCLGSGPLSSAKLPAIPGINDFNGKTFHTSRWDFDYTGGNEYGGLDRLADKRVAVVGTGATAVQCIPHLGAWAKRLYVFQRTPASVDVRANKPTDPDWWNGLEPGWQQKRMANFDSIIAGIPQDEDLVGDSWTDIWRNLAVWAKEEGQEVDGDHEALTQLADFRKMEQIRSRVHYSVNDPQTAEALKPYYNQFCKRPCYHDEYLDSFNLPNVTLVNTDGKGVDAITSDAVVFAGKNYDVDCIIFATGFEVGAHCYDAGGFEVTGRGGVKLSEKWADGVRSLHGMYSNAFPNLGIIGGIHQASVTINFSYILGEQGRHFAQIVKYCLDNGVRTFEPTPAAEERWRETIAARSVFRETFFRDCTPSYINNEGELENSLFANIFGGGFFEYMGLLDEWRATGMREDLAMDHEAG